MTVDNQSVPKTKGLVMHSEARYYDLLAWMLTLGRERAFRDRLLDLAHLAPGEAVLDVGCGTGTLAIAARRRVGDSGSVDAIDASPEMIARATRKAADAGATVRFRVAVVEELPFPDATFDVVFSTLMLHHLPRPARRQCVEEIRRVLKPGGRLLAVDFATPARARKGVLARMHRHGHLALEEIVSVLGESGLRVAEVGSVGVSDLHFALATASDGTSTASLDPAPTTRSLPPLPMPRWVFALVLAFLLVAHGIVVSATVRRLALPVLALAALGALFVVAHAGVGGAIHALLRRRRRS
ncbi:MAG: methyltransferase domain-containing protein [Gemmatimonadaceae bacterium]|nr:methyltransferase domain-containing protein [Gemmatimonadaceae bacterium]NUQ94067.1 methyltransferase domain-containing protein [Gemmatimonadaceae bacterium]NUR21096.1 methyltransferase domain-containing protein [Gemmatimonadaceae bacterium]NUS97243.1 methyltransferase domain-containing protein [Gemmatimonadaceae bacterium]